MRDNNETEQVIRMSELRIRYPAACTPYTEPGIIYAIRTYLATAAHHGIGWLESLTRAAGGNPWIPDTA